MSKEKLVAEYLDLYTYRLKNILKKIDSVELSKIIKLLIRTFSENNTVYVIGNGGSASTASHMQSDFGFFLRDYTKFRPKVVSLTDNISLITAISNDTSYDNIFKEQLNGKFTSSDVLIAISASGNSLNVINATKYANKIGGSTVAFTGFDGGELAKVTQYSLHTPNTIGDYGPIEDIHVIISHIIINYLSTDQEFLSIN